MFRYVVGVYSYMCAIHRPNIYQPVSLEAGRLLRTTVSVTKGIGRALLGGCFEGEALLVGRKGGNDEMQRLVGVGMLRKPFERAARRLDRSKGSMFVCCRGKEQSRRSNS